MFFIRNGGRFVQETTPGLEAARTLAHLGEVALAPLFEALKNLHPVARANAAL